MSTLNPLNHVHICQVSLQQCCGHTCQIWTWVRFISQSITKRCSTANQKQLRTPSAYTYFYLIELIYKYSPKYFYSTVPPPALLFWWFNEETWLFGHFCSWAPEKDWNWGWGYCSHIQHLSKYKTIVKLKLNKETKCTENIETTHTYHSESQCFDWFYVIS